MCIVYFSHIPIPTSPSLVSPTPTDPFLFPIRPSVSTPPPLSLLGLLTGGWVKGYFQELGHLANGFTTKANISRAFSNY